MERLQAALGEVSEASQQLSQGATEQAASAQEVSSSVEQMSANIRQTADNSMQTEKTAIKAAGDLASQAEGMQEAVGFFKLRERARDHVQSRKGQSLSTPGPPRTLGESEFKKSSLLQYIKDRIAQHTSSMILGGFLWR